MMVVEDARVAWSFSRGERERERVGMFVQGGKKKKDDAWRQGRGHELGYRAPRPHGRVI